MTEHRDETPCPRWPSTSRTRVGLAGMWTFLATDAMGFGGLFVAYAVLRVRADAWPDPRAHLGAGLAAAMTFGLLASAFTMTLAARATAARARLGWLGATVGLGARLSLGRGRRVPAALDGRRSGAARRRPLRRRRSTRSPATTACTSRRASLPARRRPPRRAAADAGGRRALLALRGSGLDADLHLPLPDAGPMTTTRRPGRSRADGLRRDRADVRDARRAHARRAEGGQRRGAGARRATTLAGLLIVKVGLVLAFCLRADFRRRSAARLVADRAGVGGRRRRRR